MVIGYEDEDGNPIPNPNVRPQPAQGSGTKLKKAPLQGDNPPRFTWGNYVAMSYAWGDPNEKKEIILNGHSVQVTTNLESGLRHFRNMEYFRKGGKIWIDALCINQEDVPERNEQVAKMGLIYKQAGNIIVWLGPESDSSDSVIILLEQFSIYYRTEFMEAMDDKDPHTAHSFREVAHIKLRRSLQVWVKKLTDGNLVLFEDILVPLYDFFIRPYWRRLWIIQELGMGRAGMAMVVGNHVTQWRYIRDAVFILAGVTEILKERTIELLKMEGREMEEESAITHIASIAQIEIHGHRKILNRPDGQPLPIHSTPGPTSGPLRGTSLKRVLELASYSRASNARDRVFGLLELPGLPHLKLPFPDYNKSTRQIFKEFAQACILRGSLEIFAFLDGMPVRYENNSFPSWVPPLNHKPRQPPGIIEGQWHASGNQQGFVVGDGVFVYPRFLPANDDLLECYGFIVETIDGLGAIHTRDKVHFEGTFPFGVVQPRNKHPFTNGQGGSFADDADFGNHIWYTLVGGTSVNGARAGQEFRCLLDGFPSLSGPPPPAHSPDLANWEFLSNSRTLSLANAPLSSYFTPLSWTSRPNPAHLAAAKAAMTARTLGRRLAVTNSGFMALVPMYTQPDDVVLILIGHSKPVVAREVGWYMSGVNGDEKRSLYTIIGEAFVSGLMMWEGMRRDIYSGKKIIESFMFM
ncbi:heterokaryon incompatibility protein-domain-containing protein [Tricladium varicosporioides]|nr:heterokaryon incompatibility protein-domain-containing protein [Hymenoscyphus varicosporioides]